MFVVYPSTESCHDQLRVIDSINHDYRYLKGMEYKRSMSFDHPYVIGSSNESNKIINEVKTSDIANSDLLVKEHQKFKTIFAGPFQLNRQDGCRALENGRIGNQEIRHRERERQKESSGVGSPNRTKDYKFISPGKGRKKKESSGVGSPNRTKD
ncbi:hypothetical protein AVEN_62433-1, partial [Araneus ventricosus]